MRGGEDVVVPVSRTSQTQLDGRAASIPALNLIRRQTLFCRDICLLRLLFSTCFQRMTDNMPWSYLNISIQHNSCFLSLHTPLALGLPGRGFPFAAPHQRVNEMNEAENTSKGLRPRANQREHRARLRGGVVLMREVIDATSHFPARKKAGNVRASTPLRGADPLNADATTRAPASSQTIRSRAHCSVL